MSDEQVLAIIVSNLIAGAGIAHNSIHELDLEAYRKVAETILRAMYK